MSSVPELQRGDAEPSIGELIKSLVADLGHLVRTEITRARSEISANIDTAKHAFVYIAIGGVLALAALIELLNAIVGWLTPYVGAGWAAFIVAVVVGGIGALLAMRGVRALSASGIAPTRTIESVKRDAEAIKGHA